MWRGFNFVLKKSKSLLKGGGIISCILCLFVWFFPTREFFTYMQTSPLPVKGCKLLTYARHSWPLSSEGALTCHTHCDTGLPFIMVFSEDPLHSHLLLNVWQWNSHYLFLRLRSVATGDRTPMSRMRGERSTSMPPRRFKPVLNNQLACIIITLTRWAIWSIWHLIGIVLNIFLSLTFIELTQTVM